ncbi:MAG: hypothetical protein M2R46_05395 [Verrucomicrobia subdivision 3 bacterium]|nr:hypothetical protein [Limisphaerales bacterium]
MREVLFIRLGAGNTPGAFTKLLYSAGGPTMEPFTRMVAVCDLAEVPCRRQVFSCSFFLGFLPSLGVAPCQAMSQQPSPCVTH